MGPTMSLGVISCLFSLMIVTSGTNFQSWSKLSYLHTTLVLTCNETFENYTVTDGNFGVWRKLDQDGNLTTDTDFELTNNNLDLVIRNVTDQMAGIYLCDVIGSSGLVVARSINGVNIGGHLYDTKLQEYKTNIITGIITAAAFFAIIVGICLIDRFKYLSDEQKQKRRQRKEELRRRFNRKALDGKDNLAMADDLENSGVRNYGSLKPPEGTTHL